MGWLLDILYLLAGVLLSPWLLYRAAASGRRDLARRFGCDLGAPLSSCIWLHGSSVGEVSLLRPLVALLERDRPQVPLVISAFTVTGLAAARKLYPQHRVVPLPLDLSFVVARCLRRFDPRLVVVVESEFWPNFIAGARRWGAAVALLNGRMSAKSYRVHARTGVVAAALRELDLLAVQSQEHAERFRALGVASERVHVTGNMKYDLTTAGPAREHGAALRGALGYSASDVVLIGGSLHAREDEALLDAYAAARARHPEMALVIVPRYPADAVATVERVRGRGYPAVLKTAVDAGHDVPPGRAGVLVVDTVGELRRLYAAADIAFVGGSLFFRGSNKGGHNLMEPAILAVPVVFGPYNFSFKETVDDLLAANAARLVRDPGELVTTIAALVDDAALRRELGRRGERVVRAGQGATQRNYALLGGLLAPRP